MSIPHTHDAVPTVGSGRDGGDDDVAQGVLFADDSEEEAASRVHVSRGNASKSSIQCK